jgi:hypothetical protein
MGEEELEGLRAASLGASFAVQSVLRCLILTHPRIDELMGVLQREGNDSLAVLLGSRAPDESIEAFRDTWNSIVPEPTDSSAINPRL